MGAQEDDSECGWRGRSGHHFILTKDACVLKEAKDTGNKTLGVLLMTIWLLILARLNPMQVMMEVVLSATH